MTHAAMFLRVNSSSRADQADASKQGIKNIPEGSLTHK
jgi:hypothetical protein